MLRERRFYGVPDILTYAYKCEAAKAQPSMMSEYTIIGTNPLELDTLESIADGFFQKNRAMRALDTRQRHVIAAYYRCPVDRKIEGDHEYSIRYLADEIKREKNSQITKYFFQDIIKEWTLNGKEYHKEPVAWWSRHLNKPYGTLYGLAYRNEPQFKSIKHLLRIWLNDAEIRLEPVFSDILY